MWPETAVTNVTIGNGMSTFILVSFILHSFMNKLIIFQKFYDGLDWMHSYRKRRSGFGLFASTAFFILKVFIKQQA